MRQKACLLLVLLLSLLVASSALAAVPTLYESVVPFAGCTWLVIGLDGEGIASEESTATLLLSKEDTLALEKSRFAESKDGAASYDGSIVQQDLLDMYAALPEEAQAQVLPRDLSGEAYMPAEPQPLWLLSRDEVETMVDAGVDLAIGAGWLMRERLPMDNEFYLFPEDHWSLYIIPPHAMELPRPAVTVNISALAE